MSRRFVAGPRATTPRPPFAISIGMVLAGALASGCMPADEPTREGAPDPGAVDEVHDVVILDGRVIDPASGLDGVRNVGVLDGRVAVVAEEELQGRDTVDASGLVVAPGFIDMHAHGQDEENERLKARDGRTTLLELEVGTADVEAWYRERGDGARLHHGVSVGHIPVRIDLKDDPSDFLPSGPAAHDPADDEEIAEIRSRLEEGLRQGALGVGFGLQYTPAASRWEVLEGFRAAAGFDGAPAFVHKRYMGEAEPENSIAALQEVLAASAVTGAPLHIHHIHSVGLGATPRLLRMIEEARERGMNVTAEVYPYTAGMTSIQSAIFDEGWEEVLGIGPEDLEWVATGERLTPETFRQYRAEGGSVILHFIPEEALLAALESPFAVVASDGRVTDGRGHPRTSGTAARVLGRYVRDEGVLTLEEAIRRLSYLPASRLEARVPDLARKGRIEPGADADLVLFDPETVIDRATYEEPTAPSEGILHVLVHGTFVVRDGELEEEARPGQPVRAPLGGDR